MKPALLILLILLLLALAGCNKTKVGSWMVDQGGMIEYKGIRTEDRQNKVRSEMDK